MIINAQRTLYNVDLYLNIMLRKDYKIIANTSLNEKFDILSKVPVPAGVYPTLQYWAIGTGGNNVIGNATGFSYSEHTPLDGALFNHVPFIMRPVTDDLTALEKSKYRMRKLEIVNDREYACYYLKVIPTVNLTTDFYKIVTRQMPDGHKDSILYLVDMNDPTILNPTPRDRRVDINAIDSTIALSKLAKLEFNLTEEEIQELKKVYELKKIERGQITELAACTGIDNHSLGYAEATCTQVAFFFEIDLDLTVDINKNGSINKVLEIGGGEGLIK